MTQTPLDIVAPNKPELADLSLAELAEIVSREHEEVGRAVSVALTHAIRAGEALIVVRDQIPNGEWLEWASNNISHIAYSTLTGYIRLAHYKAEVLASSAESPQKALEHLRGLPAVSGYRRQGRIEQESVTTEAQRLREEGLSHREIGEKLGISREQVRLRLNPARRREIMNQAKAKKAERRAASKALERERREKEIKKKGGHGAAAYSLLRRCLQELDFAIREGEDRESMSYFRDAMKHGHQAEDAIVKAMKVPGVKHADKAAHTGA